MSSRARYIASCLGAATRLTREGEESSSQVRPKWAQVASVTSASDGALPRRVAPAAGVQAVEHVLGELVIEWAAGERGERHHADQGTLERAHVVRYALGDLLEHPILDRSHIVLVGSLAQDRDPGGEVGWLDVSHETALEALTQAVFERLQVARRPVGCQDDLASPVVEGVEGVEELLLGTGLALEELDVVDEQHVDMAKVTLKRTVCWPESECRNSFVKASPVVSGR